MPGLVGALVFDLYVPRRTLTWAPSVASMILATGVCFGCRDIVNAAAAWRLDPHGGSPGRRQPLPPIIQIPAYYPALALLDRPGPLGAPAALGYASPAVAAAAAAAAGWMWRTGVRHSRSTGSCHRSASGCVPSSRRRSCTDPRCSSSTSRRAGSTW
jgi:hypothetical protein